MKQRLLLLFLITGSILLCTLSCSKKPLPNTHLYGAFSTCLPLHGESVPLDTALFRYPFRIAVRDSIMLVMDLHNADNFYHAFSYPDGKHVASFGQRGEGPDEVLSPENIRFYSLDSIWTLDGNKMEMVRWQLSPQAHTVERAEYISLNRAFTRVLDFIPMDSYVLIPDYSGKNRYHRMDYAGSLISTHAQIPIANDDNSTPALAQAWRSFMATGRGGKKLVMATQLGEVIEIHDMDDETVYVLTGPNEYPKYQVAEGYAVPNGIMGFHDVQVSGDHIYAVFDGRSFEERMQQYAKGEKPESGGRNIYVFDLDGNPVCQYLLDHAVSGIFVDEIVGLIIATDVNSDQPIVRYHI